jgi:hypothetical protein
LLRWKKAVEAQLEVDLPGFAGLFEQDPKISPWIATQEDRITAAIRDVDEVLFEQALGAWAKAHARVNEMLAEQYRATHSDPELWELRYIRWMAKVHYIVFASPRGEFLLYPRRPTRRPAVVHWYTVEEMIDMLHPNAIALMALSDTMPGRPELASKKPGPNEKHLQVHVENGQVTMKYDCGEVPFAGEGVR